MLTELLLVDECDLQLTAVWLMHQDDRTALYKTKSLDGVKPNTNPKSKTKTNPNLNTNHNPNPIQLFYAFFEHRPQIFSLAH